MFFLAGGLSEVAASLLVAPVEVVKARMQLGADPHRATGGLVGARSNFTSVPAGLAGVYRERGLRGLTAGWNAGLMMDMTYSATQFLLYETIKGRLRAARAAGGGGGGGVGGSGPGTTDEDGVYHLATSETLAAGCMAGGISALLTNPLDVITSRLMVQDHSNRYGGGMWEVARFTIREGPVAMWRGALPRAAQLAPMSAVAFSVYEAMKLYLGRDGAGGSGGDHHHLHHDGAVARGAGGGPAPHSVRAFASATAASEEEAAAWGKGLARPRAGGAAAYAAARQPVGRAGVRESGGSGSAAWGGGVAPAAAALDGVAGAWDGLLSRSPRWAALSLHDCAAGW